MGVQRRRGHPCRLWRQKLREDRRGNQVLGVDLNDEPYELRASFWPQRGSKAEVPGQQQIEVYTMIFEPDLDGVGLFSRVEWAGRMWDVVAPPVHHSGPRGVRHTSMDIRARPAKPEEV